MISLAKTLGELKQSGYTPLTVKEEMRQNLIKRLKENQPLFPGIIGYDKTVIPGLRNAILSRHDFILLGLRGQAKSRILRNLIHLLDEWIPAVKGCEINDNPFAPTCNKCKALYAQMGDELPIRWIHKAERYREKLATPDVTIADLIGDIDPIKAATQHLSYSDEGVIHYGIIPRTNRGIFAINELPDLPPRIQVGLLNIMEEKDIQIRSFPVRIPLDILMVYTANPEDYTNRGNIITPLKDRIDSQIMTHYPQTLDDAMTITAQEAWLQRNKNTVFHIPSFFKEIVEETAFMARKSEFVDQKSGVSARMTINLMENIYSNMEYRGILHEEQDLYPRICDLQTALTAMTGKMELVYEGEQEGAILVARKIIGLAVKKVFQRYFPSPVSKPRSLKAPPPEESPYQPILDWFTEGHKADINDTMPLDEYYASMAQVRGLKEIALGHLPAETPGEAALVMEFTLEGLHQYSLISKRDIESSTSYRDMLKDMLDHAADRQKE
jgi:magnesium chelatase subunit I